MREIKVTVRNLIQKSMKTIGVLGAGENCTDDEAQDALDLLNEIIGKFNNENLFFSGSRFISIKLDGSNEYKLNYNDIDEVRQVYLSTSTNYIPLRNYSEEEFLRFRYSKDLNTEQGFFVEYSYEGSKLHLVPMVASGELFITTNQRLTYFSSIDDIISMPDGWEICLRYSLAIRLCTMYGKPLAPEVIEEAASTKALLKNNMEQKSQNTFYGDYPFRYRRSF